MRARRAPDAAIDTFAHYYEQLARGRDRACCPSPRSSRSRTCRTLDDLPDGASAAARRGGRAQAQRRPRHEHGHDAGEVAARGQGRADVPRRDRAPGARAARARPGARLPLVLMNSFARTTTRWRRSRATTARVRRAARLRAAQGAEDPRRRPAAGRVARRPGAGVVPARPRRPLHGAARPRGCSTTLLERGYRYAFVSNSDNLGAVLDPRILAWIAREEIPFVMEVTRPHGGRPQGRPPRARGPTAARAARDRADAGGGPRRVPGHRPPPLLQHEQPVGRPAARCATSCASATACSGCR